MERKTINLLGTTIDVLDVKGLGKKITQYIAAGIQTKIMYVNTDCMLIAKNNPEYQDVLNNADLVYADGIGVVLGARLWGNSLPDRLTAADFMPDLCRDFAKQKLRIYLLGAIEGVAEDAAKSLQKKIPNLLITGTHHGYFKQEQCADLIAEINAARPDIILVGFGAPQQEFWIHENSKNLDAKVVWGVGGLFDFLSGKTRRGPKLLLDNGFEWLCRLTTEPKRLWRRYLIGNTKFILYLLWARFGGGRRNNHAG
ncbi:MAG: WecB/TagA/CpsF family glycosyltransferase [Thermodesulfobacteriota bacterium]|nr:WecB/TagA/CpsF family glycosyltransferase [Thermodesulfobacteriota bacterium]